MSVSCTGVIIVWWLCNTFDMRNSSLELLYPCKWSLREGLLKSLFGLFGWWLVFILCNKFVELSTSSFLMRLEWIFKHVLCIKCWCAKHNWYAQSYALLNFVSKRWKGITSHTLGQTSSSRVLQVTHWDKPLVQIKKKLN